MTGNGDTSSREEHQRDIAIRHIRDLIDDYGRRSRRANWLYLAVGATMVLTGAIGGAAPVLGGSHAQAWAQVCSIVTAVIAFIQTTARFNEDAVRYGTAHGILSSALTSYNLGQIIEADLDKAQLAAKAVIGKRYTSKDAI